MLQEQETLTVEEDAKRCYDNFADWWRLTVADYGIQVNKYSAKSLEAQRVAHLCSRKITILLQKPFGEDVAYAFYYWALKKRVSCPNRVYECEYKPSGKKRKIILYPNVYHRIFPELYFGKFVEIAEKIITPSRIPVIRRIPVVRLYYPKES